MEKWLVPRKYVICEETFRRAFRDGKPIGFSLRLRIPEYRSLPLALVGGFHIQVDGKVYENLTVTSEGLTFRPEEMETVRQMLTAALPDYDHIWDGEIDGTLSVYIGDGVLGAAVQVLD